MTTTERSSRPGIATIVTIFGTLAGTVIAYLSFAATVNWPPFTDDPVASPSATSSSAATVVVVKGDSAVGRPGCQHTACAFVGLELRGFSANASVTCVFDSSIGGGKFEDMTAKLDTAGVLRMQSSNYFGNPGGWVSATCNGVRGELNPW